MALRGWRLALWDTCSAWNTPELKREPMDGGVLNISVHRRVTNGGNLVFYCFLHDLFPALLMLVLMHRRTDPTCPSMTGCLFS
jgi:hypothetical protein